MFLSYILFELLDVTWDPIITQKCQMKLSRPCAGYRPPFPQGKFCTLWFNDTALYRPQNEIRRSAESDSVNVLHHVTYVTRKTALSFPDNVQHDIFRRFWSLAQVKELLITLLHIFSIHFINVLSFCHSLCYLVFHMLFPSISMAVIDYTCITPVSEYSKCIRLLFK